MTKQEEQREDLDKLSTHLLECQRCWEAFSDYEDHSSVTIARNVYCEIGFELWYTWSEGR